MKKEPPDHGDTHKQGSFSRLERAIQWWLVLNGVFTILCSAGLSAPSTPLFIAYNGGVVRFNRRCIHLLNRWPGLSLYKPQYCKHSLKIQKLACLICYKLCYLCYLGIFIQRDFLFDARNTNVS